jgi:hypothetical protein
VESVHLTANQGQDGEDYFDDNIFHAGNQTVTEARHICMELVEINLTISLHM